MSSNEKFPVVPTPEQAGTEQEKRVQFTPEEQLQAWLKDHPEHVTAPDARKEHGPYVEQFLSMVAAFESEHPLDQLHAITDLTPSEAPSHPIREPARKALNPILTFLKKIGQETDIPADRLDELTQGPWKRIHQAVGMINSGKVDHTR